MNILLCSVGRRPYLVRWFREALEANGLTGKVIAADLDPYAPARAFSDVFIEAPPVADPEYRRWLRNTLEDQQIDLAVSINDFELSEWALIPKGREWQSLIRLSSETQALVEDKLAMAETLQTSGILTPRTWSGSQANLISQNTESYVTKGRFGSASRGLHFTSFENLNDVIDIATREVTTRQGKEALSQDEFQPQDLVIVQEQVFGTEYGLDVVSDLRGDYAGVLARRKIAMRSGETDRAISVDSEEFEEIARSIAAAVPHQGTIDVDVIVDSEANAYVIDVNPRFGGGYPFSHLSGARLPHAYVAWRGELRVNPDWLHSQPGVTGSKFIEVAAVS